MVGTEDPMAVVVGIAADVTSIMGADMDWDAVMFLSTFLMELDDASAVVAVVGAIGAASVWGREGVDEDGTSF